MFIAGIDGGGTSTKLEIRTAENRFVRRESFGAFNISAIGEEGFAARLREVLARLRGHGRLRRDMLRQRGDIGRCGGGDHPP